MNNLTAIESNLPAIAFNLFRYWLKKIENENISIKDERVLVEDLKMIISRCHQKIANLDKKVDIHWKINYWIGFVGGNLSTKWYQDYVTKGSTMFKTFVGLKAIQIFMNNEEIEKIKLNHIYETLLLKDNNLDGLDTNVEKLGLDTESFEITQETTVGKVENIINNLLLQIVPELLQHPTEIDLPLENFIEKTIIQRLITENNL